MSSDVVLQAKGGVDADWRVLEHACPLADATSGIDALQGRRRSVCDGLASTDPLVCLSAWHAVLHLLRHADDPVSVCVRGAVAGSVLLTNSAADAGTTFAELHAVLCRQWRGDEHSWPRIDDAAGSHAEALADHLRCHAVLLGGVQTPSGTVASDQSGQLPEFALIRQGDRWTVDCDGARYSSGYVETVIGLWRAAIGAAVDSPQTPVSALRFESLLSVASASQDAKQGTLAGVAVGTSGAIEGSLVSRFVQTVATAGTRAAAIDIDGSIDYASLDVVSTRWAFALQSAGVARGECVGVSFDRSRWMVAAQLAVLKAGAVFVPLDAGQPGARLSSIADDADLQHVLCAGNCADALRAALPGIALHVADALTPADAGNNAENKAMDASRLPQDLGPDDPAYVIFTSGSTGRPKGVKVSHGNLLNFVDQIRRWVAQGSVMSQFAPFTFDASVAEIHACVLNGCTLVMPSQAMIDDPDALQAYFSSHCVVFSAFPPQYAKHLSPEKMPHLKLLMTAGSAPDHDLIARWLPHATYVNGYGPTETTVLSTGWLADHAPLPGEPIAIGPPMRNTIVKVVDRFDRTLPPGCIGELLIGGAGVAIGYLKRDELNAQKFVVDDAGIRWYRSGDLACLAANGELIFAGRIDDQIKLRGHRLEPGEVEVALASLPGIRHAAVIAVDTSNGKQLIAFCAGEPRTEDDVRAMLADALPAWAIPNRFVWQDALPTTVNGKIDYHGLRRDAETGAVGTGTSDAGMAIAAEFDPVESEVAGIWRNVLQQPVQSADANFVHLGGDSLTSLVVVSALKRSGWRVTSSQLLAHPRLGDFAALLQHNGSDTRRDDSRVAGTAALGPIQGWFFDLGLRKPGGFCQSLVFETAETLDADRLQVALHAVCEHHDGLRVRFVEVVGQGWRQEIAAESPALPPIHVESVDDDKLDTATERLRTALATELDIGAAPLFRMALLRSAQRSRVVWVLHHLVVDTISHGVLLDDLQQMYASGGDVPERVLPGKSTSYLQWAEALLEHVDAHPQAHLDGWAQEMARIADAGRLPLQTGVATADTIAVVDCRFSREQTAALIEYAGCYRQSPEALVLAATYLAFQRRFDMPRLAIDVEWHGRDDATGGASGIDRTIGWFTSVHPLCMERPGAAGLGEWLMALKERRAEVPHRGRYFYAMRYLSCDPAVRAAFADYAAPEILFNFSGMVQRSQAGWATVPTVAIEMGEGNVSPYAVSVESEIRNGELIVALYLRDAAWTSALAESVLDELRAAMDEILGHCAEPAHRRWTASDFPRVPMTRAELDRLPVDTLDVYPLTDMQQTMYRHKDTYQVVMCYRMPFAFDEGHWRAAVADWIGRHDCLRTCIREREGGELCQIVLAGIDAVATVHRVPVGGVEAEVARLIAERRAGEVRIDRAPLFAVDAVHEEGDAHADADGVFHCVLTIHHIIHDGWSIDLLLNDLCAAYRHRAGLRARMPAAPLASMADVVDAQRRLAEDPQWHQYWTGLGWSGAGSQLPVMSDVHPAADSAEQSDVRLYSGVLAPELAEAVRTGARVLGVTVNSLWLAGYVCLLRYLGGQSQVRCGVIQNGRMEEIAGVETVTGCCVNNLPLVLDIAGNDQVGAIVSAVAAQLDRMRESAAYPLSRIHEAVKSRIDGEMFGTLFNIESHHYGAHHADVRPTLVGGFESTNYPFVFSLIERQQDLMDSDGPLPPPEYEVRIGYDARSYELASVEEWLTIYAECVRALIGPQDIEWLSLRLLPEPLLRRIVGEWNDTTRAFPDTLCVPELFREHALARPDHPALLHRDRSMSFAELDARSDQLAAALIARGIAPQSVIGLLAERSFEMVVAMLGIFKAGCAYVPIDPRYPVDRVQYMLEQTKATLVLAQHRGFTGVLPETPTVEYLFVDAYVDAPLPAHVDAGQAKALATVPRSSRDLAYVMYTSGSTGAPKGVMIEHRSIARLTRNSEDLIFAPEDRVLLNNSPGFDATTLEIWIALLNGLTLGMVDEEVLLSPTDLAAEIASKQITLIIMIAPLFHQLVQELPEIFKGLKQLMVAGDTLSPTHVALARSANAGLQVINGYGPTENTTASTYHYVREEDTDLIPIGKPITNSTTYVFNQDGQLLPPGVDGELYVGGPGVARGYLNRPDLTAEKFVADPFSADPEARLYRTGDLARWRRDGLLDFRGRIDHQVKIRGFRIELGEIENAICAHPDIKMAAVTVKQEGRHKQLIAYCVAKDDVPSEGEAEAALIQSVMERMRRAVPDYMMPAAFVVLPSLPRNANGKVDRAQLPDVDAQAFMRGIRVAPDTDAERLLHDVWREVLGMDAFGVTDSFFALGGDSIMAIQVASLAAKSGLIVSQRSIIEEKTIRDIAAKASARDGAVFRASGDDTANAPLAPTATAAAAAHASGKPAAKGEQRLLPLQYARLQARRGAGPVHVASVVVPDACGPAVVQAALMALLSRHDALRLKFRETPSGWLAQYGAGVPASDDAEWSALLVECNVSSFDDADAMAAERAAARAALDIRKGRLCAWRLLRQADGAQRLLCAAHGLIADAASWRLLLADHNTALSAAMTGADIQAALGARPDSAQAWASAVHAYAFSAGIESQRGFWLDQLVADTAGLGAATTAGVTVSRRVIDLQDRVRQRLFDRCGAAPEDWLPALTAAVASAICDTNGKRALRLDIEREGRTPVTGDDAFADVARCDAVGGLACVHPLRIVLDDAIATSERDASALLRDVQVRFAEVPAGGLGYGALLALAHDEALSEAHAVIRNDAIGDDAIGDGAIDVGSDVLVRCNALPADCDVRSDDLEGRTLRITLSADSRQASLCCEYDAAALPGDRAEILFHAIEKALSEVLPAPGAGLVATARDALQARYPNAQDAYACTGMQSAMLLLSDGESDDGVYISQITLDLVGADTDRLRRSWEHLIARHAVLRTAFLADGDEGLIQVVCAQATLPWQMSDLSMLPDAARAETAERILEEARMRAFDSTEAPLMRLNLIVIGDDRLRMAWSYHHALIDGWSMGMLLKELIAIYDGLYDALGAAPAMVDAVIDAMPQPRAFGDYVAWLAAQDQVHAIGYWKDYLAGLDVAASASLPAALPDPQEVGEPVDARKCVQARELDAGHSAELVASLRKQGISLSTAMIAAWGLLLTKYSNDREALFGYTTSGRSVSLDGIESMIGLFINSLPIRLTVDGDTRAGAWLAQIQSRLLDHEERVFVPLSQIQRQAERRAGQGLFQSLVVVENFPLDPALFSSTSATGLQVVDVAGAGQNDMPLVLTVFPGERLKLELAYRVQRFDDATVTLLLERLERLLLGLVRAPEQPLSALRMLGEAELERAIHTWNSSAADYDRDRMFNEIFHATAARDPDATALVAGDERWSYGRLATRARAIATWLQTHGVRPGDKVALSLPREPELVAAMMGVLHTGAAYVPVALDMPVERRAYMISNAGVRLIVTGRDFAGQVAGTEAEPLFLEDCPHGEDILPTVLRPEGVGPESAAYVMYTSGTTGMPKGVEVTHRNLVNYARWFQDAGYAGARDRIAQFAPFTFDVSAGEIYATLQVGAELHFLSDAMIQSPRDLETYYSDNRITFSILPPPYLHQMEPSAVPADMVMSTLGSAPTTELVRRWSRHCRYVNTYGPTETTILSSTWEYRATDADEDFVTIGRPINNSSLYIVDRLGQLCAPGVIGEVWIGGDGVSRGYYNRPELTESVFLADPWKPGERVYRAGDLGRWLEDGRIEFLGRNDRQVKVRGYRIELNEIEDRLRQHPALGEVSVQVRGDDDRKRLLGWIVRKDRRTEMEEGIEPFVAGLREFIAESLPSYMVPQAFMLLDALPLTTNGKLNARALPEPGDQDWLANNYVAPNGNVETLLVGIWSDLLKVPANKLGVESDFFALGGDSIMAIQAASRAGKQGIPLSPRRIIEARTIRAVASSALARNDSSRGTAVQQDNATGATKPDTATASSSMPATQLPSESQIAALRARYAPVEAVYPCTGMQQGMLMLVDGMDQDGLYVSQLCIDLGAVDSARLRRSWEILIARHPILRTMFPRTDDGDFVQVVRADVTLPWEEADLRDAFSDEASGAQQMAELDALVVHARQRGFALDAAPLMRVLLARLDDTRYEMVWTHHHALIDGWSMASLAQELFATYDALGSGEPDAVARPHFEQYLEWLQQRDWSEAQSYWASYFSGIDIAASAELPPARTRHIDAGAQRYAQSSVQLSLEPALSADLARLCREERVSFGTVIMAAWAMLLSKYNPEDEVLFGYTTSGRPADIVDVEHLLGLFINSLPLRVAVNADARVGEWLRGIQSRQLDNDDRAFVPLSEIHRASGRRAGRPLFESLVVVENFPIDRERLSTEHQQPQIFGVHGHGQTDFALNLVAIPGERPSLELAYQQRRFDQDTVREMLKRLQRILEGLAIGGARRLADIAILSESEQVRAVDTWNDTATGYARDSSLHALFAEQVRARPDAVAVVCGETSWSYRDLDRRAHSIVRALHAAGVASGDRVGLTIEKTPDMVAAMIAIHIVGGAYVPIAVDCPPERRDYIIADAGIKHVLSARAHVASLDGSAAGSLYLDDVDLDDVGPDDVGPDDVGPDAVRNRDIAITAAGVSGNAEAYVIYTSGTTGTPKGVAISHRNCINFCLWCSRPGMIAPGMRTSQFAPYTFDAASGEIFSALTIGAELHLLPGGMIQEPRVLAAYYRERDIQFSAFPPPYLQQLDPDDLPAGMVIVTAGSAPSEDLVRRWGSRFPYVNGYGPTETTILSTSWHCAPGTYDGGRLPIGRPITNTSIYVVDRMGQLCAPGMIGEILIAGDGVALGYLNRDDLNATQFGPDPWRPGQRLYRTGDHGRWLEDGNIEFIGRRDRQIKLRGYRIELGEIETRMLQHAGVETAVVAARGDNDDKRLLAWVVRRSHAATSDQDISNAAQHTDDAAFIDDLRAFMAQALPAYMLPQAILCVAAMPLTANGKIDDRALPDPAEGELFAGEWLAPRDDLEIRLAAVWADALQLPATQVGANADFFELGGNSLLAMRVVARIREALNTDIGVADLLSHPVLGDLADVLRIGGSTSRPPIVARDRSQPLPLSYAQQRLWFLDQMDGASDTYNIPGALRLQGRLDHAALQRALDRIVARHEVLRTSFIAADGAAQLRVADEDVGFALRFLDLRNHADRDERLQTTLREDAAMPFDLASDPLARARLLQMEDETHILGLTLHHIIIDAWSLTQLIDELRQLYDAFVAGNDDPLPPLQVQYADYAAWQRDWLVGEVWDSQSAYWQTSLRDAPAVLELSTDRLRPAVQDYTGEIHEFALDTALTAALKTLSQRHGTTMFMTMLAAWSVVLSRLSGQQDIVVGSPVTNRSQTEVLPLIGFFVNTLAFRIDLSGDPSATELLHRVRQQVIGGHRHQDLPFERVVEVVQPPRSMAHTPVFQVMLNWQDESRDALEMGGVTVSAEPSSYRLSKFDLTLDLFDDGERVLGSVEYATALFDPDTIARHVGYLMRVLEAMAADAQKPVNRIELLGDDELALLDRFNDTRRPELIQRSWPELFVEQAARTPDRIVAECERMQLTYGELEARSRLIATRLRARGIGSGHIVGLLDERGTELLTMIVATLRAGAAYVPLDPTHPPQRWLEILEEAQPSLLWVGDAFATERRWLKRKWSSDRVCATADLASIADEATAVLPTPSLDDLAYVIFTSGSTGKPKGVMIEHRGMINNMLSKFEPLGLSADDVIAQTASQCFDISVWQFLTAPLLGGRVSIFSSDTTRDPDAMLARLDSCDVTVWEPVPSVIQAILPYKAALPKLRWVLPTGEALPRELVLRWFEQYPDVPLMNAYGPAECSDDVSFQPMHGPVERVSIGLPVANAHLHVVDNNLMLLPLGAVGELAISGPVVGRGYLNRPDETDAAFRTNPYSRYDADRRLYLTSDLVRRARDGSLEFVGRKDFQVKIRGFRIELGEIESCLSDHPAVTEAVVQARAFGEGDKRLVGYVTVATPVMTDALQAHLRTSLPDYMIPSAIVILDRMPLTGNGKIDRNALPEPSFDLQATAYEPPQTPMEQSIAEVWQTLLGLPQVGRNDDFFDLGGNSILLIRMLSRVREHGVAASITDAYRLRTVKDLASTAAADTPSPVEWLQTQLWPHRWLETGSGDGKCRVLLVAERDAAAVNALRLAIADCPPDSRPDLVQPCADPEALAADVGAKGVRALRRDRMPKPAAIAQALDVAFAARAQRVKAATSGELETFPFSAIQRNLSDWQHRNAVHAIDVTGWWSADAIAAAVVDIARSQDLLHAVPDPSLESWLLLPVDVLRAEDVPTIDLRDADAKKRDAALDRIGSALMRTLEDSALRYAVAVVSTSDTAHTVAIAADHLVWDAVSAEAFKRHLDNALRGRAASSARTYRDYVADMTAMDAHAVDAALDDMAYPQLVAAAHDTRAALDARAHLPLTAMLFEVPLRADESPAEQAFAWYKRMAERMLNRAEFTIVLNHHGRQLGENAYFDQIGLFLDKVPYAVDAKTSLAHVLARVESLQGRGFAFTALHARVADAHGRVLQPPSHEMLFNFQPMDAGADLLQAVPGEAELRRKASGFCGILMEAYATTDRMAIMLMFRGRPEEVEPMLQDVPDSRVLKTMRASEGEPSVAKADVAPTAASSREFAIELHDVRKRYGDLEVVKGVSCKVPRGCCFGILGPNGAGKTSLLGMIEGITPITSGSISVMGMDVATEIRRIQPRIGVQLQQNNYFQFLTVAELLQFYGELRNAVSGSRNAVGGSRNALQVERLLDRLDLSAKMKFKVEELSGGQKQRLSIAIALLGDPEVIFLDEPSSALDPHSRRYTWEFIEELKQDRTKTIVLTTHYMEEAERLCDELMIMNQGEIIAQGAPAHLVEQIAGQQQVRFRFDDPEAASLQPLFTVGVAAVWDEYTSTMTVTTENAAAAIREAMSLSESHRITISGIEMSRPSLEEVFLSATGKGLKE